MRQALLEEEELELEGRRSVPFSPVKRPPFRSRHSIRPNAQYPSEALDDSLYLYEEDEEDEITAVTRTAAEKRFITPMMSTNNEEQSEGEKAPERPASPEPQTEQGNSDDDEDYGQQGAAEIEGVYNPKDYENLQVSSDVKELFEYITSHVPPSTSQVDIKLKPFIPEYYPSVGDIDAFIKVIHPEVKDDQQLGIKWLDEPATFQSDPSVLDLRLRAMAKQSSAKAIVVKKVDNAHKNTKVIENWIKDISDLHRSKPSPSVHYSKPMPDLDSLIQEWPPGVEDVLKSMEYPSPDLNCDLATYVDIICCLLDIPIYKSRIQSLHLLCTLYSTQKNFSQYGPLGNRQGDQDDLQFVQSDAELLTSSSSSRNHIRNNNQQIDRLQIQ